MGAYKMWKQKQPTLAESRFGRAYLPNADARGVEMGAVVLEANPISGRGGASKLVPELPDEGDDGFGYGSGSPTALGAGRAIEPEFPVFEANDAVEDSGALLVPSPTTGDKTRADSVGDLWDW